MAKSSPTPASVYLLASTGRDLYAVLNNEHPLPFVLIVSSYIEKHLAALLSAFFIESTTADALLSYSGRIGEMQARNQLAYVLGLTDKPIFENIKNIGLVRNEFAHSHAAIDFDNQKVADFCRALTFPQGGILGFPTHSFFFKDDKSDEMPIDMWDLRGTCRQRFSIVALLISETLFSITHRMTRQVPLVTLWTWPDSHKEGSVYV